MSVSSSARPATPDFKDKPIAMMVRFSETDRILRITDPVQVSVNAVLRLPLISPRWRLV